MSIICQATVASDDGKFPAWDSCAPWCSKEAVTTVPLTLIRNERVANVWLCDEHAREFYRAHEI